MCKAYLLKLGIKIGGKFYDNIVQFFKTSNQFY